MRIDGIVFCENEKQYEIIAGLIGRACNRLKARRGFNVYCYFTAISGKPEPMVGLTVTTASQYDFETARSFFEWSFEDYRRIRSLDVIVNIKHDCRDPWGLKKGEGEEQNAETNQ